MIFSGHTAQVEEVSFHPNHQDLLCSVGDDQMLMIWDMRLGGARPAIRLHTGHSDDVNAVHWNTVNDNLLLTGSSDHSVKLIDLRRVAQADSFTRRYEANSAALCAQAAAAGDQGRCAVVHTFRGHAGNVTNVQWHSDGQHFASGSDDGDLCVWSIRGVDALQRQAFPSASASAATAAMDTDDLAASRIGDSGLPPKPLWDGSADGQPEHLLFRHSGHRTAVVSFAWNPFVLDGQCNCRNVHRQLCGSRQLSTPVCIGSRVCLCVVLLSLLSSVHRLDDGLSVRRQCGRDSGRRRSPARVAHDGPAAQGFQSHRR
jgi:WD40 repeat protein